MTFWKAEELPAGVAPERNSATGCYDGIHRRFRLLRAALSLWLCLLGIQPALWASALNSEHVGAGTLIFNNSAAASSVLELEIEATPEPVAPGGIIVYSVKVANSSASSITNVVVAGIVPAGISFSGFNANPRPTNTPATFSGTIASGSDFYWNLGTFAAGESRTLLFSMSANASLADNTSIPLTLRGTATGVAERLASCATTVRVGGIAGLEMSVDQDPVLPAGSLRYTLVYANKSSSVPLLNAALEAPLPIGASLVSASHGGAVVNGRVQWPIGRVEAGASGRRDFVISVPPGVTNGTLVAAGARLAADGTGNVAQARAVVSVQTATPLDLEIAATPDPVASGSLITYAVKVSNAGAASVGGVVVAGIVPSGMGFSGFDANPRPANTPANSSGTIGAGDDFYWDLGTFAAGESRTLLFSMSANSSLPNGTLLPMKLRVTGTGVTERVATYVRAVSSRAFALEISVDHDPALPGSQLRYTINYSNKGTLPLYNTVLEAPVPSGVSHVSASNGATPESGVLKWSIGTLNPGESGRRQHVIRVQPSAVLGSIIAAEASIANDLGNSARARVLSSVGGAEPLDLEIVATPGLVSAGGVLAYNVKVSNTTPGSLAGVVVTGMVPPGIGFSGFDSTPRPTNTPANFSGTIAQGDDFYWDLGTFAAGESRTLLFTMSVSSSSPSGTLIPLVMRATTTGANERVVIHQTLVDSRTVQTPEGEFRLSATSYAVHEGQGVANITINRANGAAGAATVWYETVAGSAGEGGDFKPTYGQASFAAGETSVTIAVPVIDDGITELAETFTFQLSNPSKGVLIGTPASATVTLSDAPTATLTVTANRANGGTVSGGGTFSVGATRTISATPASADWSFSGWSDGNTQNPRSVVVPLGGASYTALFQETALLTVQASPAGAGSVSGGGRYNVGSTQQISATPAAGYLFAQWADGNSQNPRTVTIVSGGVQHTAVFGAAATLSVSASPANGGTVTGGGVFAVGATREISAVAVGGWAFTGWNDGNTQSTRTVTVPAAGAAYTANFSATALLTVTASPTNGGSVTGGGQFIVGSSQTIAATPAGGWLFTGWSDGNTANPRQVNVPAGGVTYTAIFQQAALLTLTASPANGGTVSGAGTFAAGSVRQISATANAGWMFTGWNDGNTQNPRSVTLAVGTTSFTAIFQQTAPLTLSANPSNGGTVTGAGTFLVGSTQQISATPAAGYLFAQWADGNSQNPRTVTIVSGGVQHTAVFGAAAPLSVSASPANGGTVTGDGVFAVGATREISAVAAAGWAFTGWNDGNTQSTRTVTVPAAGAAYTANFSLAATLSVVANPANGGTVSGGGQFLVGSLQNISATPASGWLFTGWNDGNTENTRQVGVPAAGATYTATFQQAALLSVLASPADGGSVSGGGTFPAGSVRQISAAANAGWIFTVWNDGNTQNPRTLTLAAGSTTLTAIFKQTASLTVQASPAEGGSVAGSGIFAVDSTQQISAAANTDWLFTRWSDGNTQNPRTVTVVAGGENNSYTALFARVGVVKVLTNPIMGAEFTTGDGTFPIGESRQIYVDVRSGYVFAGWSDGDTANPRTITVASGTTTYTANLRSLSEFAGRYGGLVEPDNWTTQPAGSIQIKVTKAGTFSGSLKLGIRKRVFKGALDAGGNYLGNVPKTQIGLNLHLDVTTGRIVGETAGSLAGSLRADRAATSANAGQFTVAVNPPSEPALPRGFGYATMKVTASGQVRLSGKLGDGSALSVGSQLSSGGEWPLYASTHRGLGAIAGWARNDADTGTVRASLRWLKPFQPKQLLYPEAFSAETSLRGSRWTAPPKGGAVLALPGSFDNALFTATGGNLQGGVLQKSITVGAKPPVLVSAPDADKLSLSIKAQNGTFKGSFMDTVLRKKRSFSGVFLSEDGQGVGVFLGVDESGSVVVEPALQTP